MECPLCGRTETGRVGNREYYCWRCCVEFHGEPGQWRLYAPDPEGVLVELADPGLPVVHEAPAPTG